jgi:hypothetical protein
MGELGPYLVQGWVELDSAGEATVAAERIEPLLAVRDGGSLSVPTSD